MLIIIFILIFLFLLNFLIYWITISKKISHDNKLSNLYKKIFPVFWNVFIFLIPIVNSSIFEPVLIINISYFYQYWLWFLLIGIIIIIFGIKIYSLARNLLKTAKNGRKEPKLLKKGVYEIVRHPQYLSWFLIYLGITFICDSFIAVIFSPILLILTELLCYLEEKYLLMIKFGEKYIHYKKKIPYRLISPPYNYIFIIIGIMVAYIGLINFIYN